MQQDAQVLAGALCARVCHDLAGTLGALSGMLDMVAAAPDPEALALAQACAHELSARLRLLRAAWGSEAEVEDYAALLPGLPGAERLSIDLTGLAVLDGDRVRQLGASLLLVAAAALPRGGHVWLSGGGRRLALRIEGRQAAWPDGLDGGAQPAPDARRVAQAMARLQAAALGLGLRVSSPTTLEVG